MADVNINNKNKSILTYIDIISIFPEMFQTIIQYGIISRAIRKKKIIINFWNPRHYTDNQRCSIDAKPYGGGVGMIMKAPPLLKAIKLAKSNHDNQKIKTIYLSPQGKKLTQKIFFSLSKYSKIILICGRYKGIDERILDIAVDEEYSIGDYIISGGELAAMVFIDAITRIKPGVIKKTESYLTDSFYKNRLDYPQYTRPYLVEDKTVPNILLSGNHEKIKQWREQLALTNTWIKKPHLLKKSNLTLQEIIFLQKYINKKN
ncbi:MAG: tRNA (guanosine(37)-N1)-methyltransferase TrmD [Buchnera aphidicola (Eriosoma harunire)]